MNTAWTAYSSWSQLGMAERARTLVKLAAVMRRRTFELAAWETFEASKNYAEAEADVAEAIDFCEYYARQALKLDGPLETYDYPGEENSSFLIPTGVGVVIPPWNFLLAILVGTTVGPVVVGNTVIVKPSPDTPIIAHIFMECVAEAGFPPGVITLLTGADADIGDLLVDHPRTRFINLPARWLPAYVFTSAPPNCNRDRNGLKKSTPSWAAKTRSSSTRPPTWGWQPKLRWRARLVFKGRSVQRSAASSSLTKFTTRSWSGSSNAPGS